MMPQRRERVPLFKRQRGGARRWGIMPYPTR
jgi:hypothetical protein